MSAAAALILATNPTAFKKLETAGREQYFQQFSDDSDSLLLDFDSDSGQTYRYRVSLSGPSNMRIIYALTQQQYQKILSSRDLFMSYANYDSLQYQSYCAAGVPNVLTGFFTASFLFGCVLVLLFEKEVTVSAAFPSASFRLR